MAKNFVVGHFLDYKMVDSKTVVTSLKYPRIFIIILLYIPGIN